MKTHTAKKIWLALSVLALAALACNIGKSGSVETPAPSANTPSNNGGIDRGHLMSATVQVLMEKKQGSDYQPFASGSGTIISADGLILTNAHVASPASQGDTASEPDRLTIAITQSEDQPPVLSYIAEVRAVDGALDLAVLQIVSTLNGTAVNKADLNLPFVQIGNSDNVHIGDHLNIFGFPGVGKETITYTEGGVSGFTSEDPPGERAWIKTAVNIAHGNSGGLAADDKGEIVGVPTQVEGDCNQADTNGDGKVDTCIPNGNAINFLRPVNFAQPLIQAAQAGKKYASPYHAKGVVSEPGTGNEALSNFVWLSSANDKCDPGNDVVKSYDTGAPCIVPAFQYSGMTKGEAFREVWTYNGKQIGDFTYSWEWKTEGKFASYLNDKGDPLPQGVYSVEFFAGADSKKLGKTPEITVGSAGDGGASPQPSSQDTVTLYGVIYDTDTNKPIPGAYAVVLKPGTTFDQWKSENFADKYVAASLQTDDTGKYKFTDIPRGVPLTYIFSANGYRGSFEDNVEVKTTDTRDSIEVNIGLSK